MLHIIKGLIKNYSVWIFLSILILHTTGCNTELQDSNKNQYKLPFEITKGAITRGDTTQKEIAIVFTGDSYAEGASVIIKTLDKNDIRSSFFFTGHFYRNPDFKSYIVKLIENGHYLGAHSDQHLLYCDWINRDSLLVSKEEFEIDILNNYKVMSQFGINMKESPYYLPPYEWYNDSISKWTQELDLTLINYSYGTLSHADYTTPGMSNYRSSSFIYNSILEFETNSNSGLNGFILLFHIGTEDTRIDKFYQSYLEKLILELKNRGYVFLRVDKLLQAN